MRKLTRSEAGPGFKPGTHGCHELLHMVAFLATAVGSEVVEHDAIKHSTAWQRLASKAEAALWELYSAIGKEHL